MPTSNFVRWGAMGALVAGLGWGVPGVLAFVLPAGQSGPAGHPLFDPGGETLHAIAEGGVLLWLVGSHALQARSYGRLGAAGFAASLAGTAVVSSHTLVYGFEGATTSGTFYQESLGFGLLVWLVGFTLLGMVVLLAENAVLPRWCGLLLVAFFPLFVARSIFFGVGGMLLGLLWLALGYALWSRRGKAVGRRSRVA